MAVRIPTFADLGFDDPRPTTGVPSFPQDDPSAQGLAALGTGLQKAGQAAETVDAYGKMAQNKMQQSIATTDLATRLIPLHTQISQETDPEKLAQLRGQLNTLTDISGQAIADPNARQMWAATHTKTILDANADADKRQVVLYRDKAGADIRTQLDQVARAAATSDDPMALPNAALAADNLLHWGNQGGVISNEDAYRLRKQASHDMVVGSVDGAINRGNLARAGQLLDQHGDDIPPPTKEMLRARIQTRGAGILGDHIYSNAISGSAVTAGGGASAPIIPKDWSPADYPNAPVESDQIISHPERNNPGNLRAADSNQWVGKTTKPGDAFESFDTPENGIRARAMTYGSYLRNGTNTIAQIADRSGPASDGNDIPSQISAYKQALGGKYAASGGENLPIDMTPENIRRLTAGGISIEAGGGGKWLPKGAGLMAIDQALQGMAGESPAAGAVAQNTEGLFNTAALFNPGGGLRRVAATGDFDPSGPSGPQGTFDRNGNPTNPNIPPPRTGGADSLVGQPPSIADRQPGTQQTPPRSPAPGMADLANAEQELAQRHARTLLSIENDPRGADNPAAVQRALQRADVDFRARQMAITAQKQAITETRNAAADNYVQRMMKGPVDPSIVQQIAADTNLDRQSRENLWALYSQHTKQSADGDTAKYGPKFFDYYHRITTADSDPNKIRDPSQIYALAVPKGDGSQDLTLAGADKLRQELQATQRDPNGANFARRLTEFYQGMRLQIDKSGALPSLPTDGRGQVKFYEFQSAVQGKVDSYIKDGKNPADLIDPSKPDYMGKPETIQPYKRTMTQALADFSSDNNGPLGARDTDLSTPDALKAAVSGGKISREQGEAEALRRGWIRTAPPPAPPAVDLTPLGQP